MLLATYQICFECLYFEYLDRILGNTHYTAMMCQGSPALTD